MQRELRQAYRDAVVVLLSDALSFGLALLEGVLVLELGTHIEAWEMCLGDVFVMSIDVG